jgi:hypothetical protein
MLQCTYDSISRQETSGCESRVSVKCCVYARLICPYFDPTRYAWKSQCEVVHNFHERSAAVRHFSMEHLHHHFTSSMEYTLCAPSNHRNRRMAIRSGAPTILAMIAIMMALIFPSSTISVQAFLTTSTGGCCISDRPIVSTRLNADTQAEYGKSAEMPSSYVTCGQCGSSYALRADDLEGGRGR